MNESVWGAMLPVLAYKINGNHVNKLFVRTFVESLSSFKVGWIAVLALMLCTLSAHAASQNTLFEASVPVMTQDASERKLAIEMGLIDVLIKNTGMGQIATRPDINQLLANAETMVTQYVYRAAADDSVGMTPLYLNMVFDSDAIRARLSELDLPFWPAPRTPVLVWLVVDTPAGRRLLGRNDPNSREWRDQMIRHAERRGVRLVFPILDAQDWSVIQISDVWNANDASIRAASQRYPTNQILVGAVTYRADASTAEQTNRWKFTADFDRQAWSDPANMPHQSINAAIDRVMASLSSYYAIRPGMEYENRITLLFTGINHPTRYAQLQTFLISQPTVAKLSLLSQEADQSLFEVTLASQSEVFLATLRHAPFLAEISGVESDGLRSTGVSSLPADRLLKRYRYIGDN